MKNLFYLTVFLFFSNFAIAQDTETHYKPFIGGSINFQTQSNSGTPSYIDIPDLIFFYDDKDFNYTKFAISPYIGKEINAKLQVGLQFDFVVTRYVTDYEDFSHGGPPQTVKFENPSTTYGFGVFSRHIINPDNKLKFHIQPYIGYAFESEKVLIASEVDREKSVKIFKFGAKIGVLYDINEKIRATLSGGGLSYVTGKWKIKDTEFGNDFNAFNTNFNLSHIFFGFELRL